MKTGFILNVPNVLSLYRLLSFPLVLFFVISGRENLFVIFLIINLVTDHLDGRIARRFHLETEFGARLDSLADIGTYILAILGIFLFKWDDFEPYQVYFFVFLALFLLPIVITLVKFRRTSSLHLYSSKIAGYLQGFFFITLYVIDFYLWFFFIVMVAGYIAFLEGSIIHLISNEPITNAKGLWWVLKNRKNGSQTD